jgi:hypothetical protein
MAVLMVFVYLGVILFGLNEFRKTPVAGFWNAGDTAGLR